jgi:hypothetical protein
MNALRIYHCPYCNEDSGIILPEDLSKERRMSDGSLMCCSCCYERLKDRIVKILPDSTRAKEIIAEDKRKVGQWNRHIQSLGPESEVLKINPRLRKRIIATSSDYV